MIEDCPVDNTTHQNIYTVSDFNQIVQKNLQKTLPSVCIHGELCGLYLAQSGHLYGSLKDSASQIKFVCYAASRKNLGFQLEEGMEVLVFAEPAIYKPKGELQIIVKKVEPLGIGALRLAFEQMKVQLEKEGLFDTKYKKTLPAFPSAIGVITSPDGAVWHDIQEVILRRCPFIPLILYPTSVQGTQAPEEICRALALASAEKKADVYLIARGGGSLQDLWAFNTESVVRSVAAFPYPIVSAIGHETDVTLCDFAADLRAGTPSIAAEIISPDIAQLYIQLQEKQQRLDQAISSILNRETHRIDRYSFRWKSAQPVFDSFYQRLLKSEMILKNFTFSFLKQIEENLRRKEQIFYEAARKVEKNKILFLQQKIQILEKEFDKKISDYLFLQQQKQSLIEKKLLEHHPFLTTTKTYVVDEKGYALSSAQNVHPHQKGKITFPDGQWEIVFVQRVK